MKRIGVVVSDDAFTVLRDYQEQNKIRTRDEAADALLKEFARMKA